MTSAEIVHGESEVPTGSERTIFLFGIIMMAIHDVLAVTNKARETAGGRAGHLLATPYIYG